MSTLHRLASLGRIDDVKKCIEDGYDINSVNKFGQTALINAAEIGHMRLARYLIEAGADINIRKPKGSSALFVAVHAKNINMVRLLLEMGADVNNTNSFGWTPAICAAMTNQTEILSILKVYKADLNIVGRDNKSVEYWVNVGGISGEFDQNEARKFFKNPERLAKHQVKLRELMSGGVAPEEYCAIHGRNILVWSYGLDEYEDPEITAWAKRVFEILRSEELIAECEEKYLNGDELESRRKYHNRVTKAAARRNARIAEFEREE